VHDKKSSKVKPNRLGLFLDGRECAQNATAGRSKSNIADTELVPQKGRLNLSILLPFVRHTDRGRENAVQEAVMARQHTTSQSLKSIGGAVLVGLGLVIVFGKLDEPAARLMSNLLGAAARKALELLFSLVPTAWQALEACAFDHHWFSGCPFEMLVSCWPLLHAVAGAL
jgi:hypothetical protein